MSPSPGTMKRHRSASSTDELVHLSKSTASTSGQPHYDQSRVKKPRIQIAEVEEVSQWLKQLSVNDQEPGEFYQEKHRVDEFTKRHPAYVEAAVTWPKYAEVYWDGLRSRIYALFNRDPKKGDYVFVQWALTYLRSTFPKSFDLGLGSPRNIIALTDALCDGSLSPLCMAATLGLPKLCDALASNHNQTDSTLITTFGSPLYCALLGKAFFVIARQPESWKDFLLNEEFLKAPNRTPIISRFLMMAGNFETSQTSPRAFRPTWKNGRPIPLMGLAFIIALQEKDLAPFAAMAHDHLQVDDSFINLFHPANKHWWPRSSPRFRASLYTFVYDLTIRYAALFAVVDKLLKVQSVVLRCMKDDGLKFNVTDPTPIMRLKDEEFEEVLRCALLDESDIAVLQRLALDPRFNPNLDMGEDSEGGLLLHHAVSGDQPDVVDFLIKHGADVEGRDAHGRTPLMVVESPQMLSKLIKTYHADTQNTDHLGSTIWHIFAATNDVDFIWALEETDPHKWDNLKTLNKNGNTPFAEALRSETASARAFDEPRYHVAQILLGYNIDGDCMRSGEPLAHLAVATSECSIIRQVHTKGIAFDGIDDKGNSPLHKVDLVFADTETVRLVATLSCEGVLENFKGYTAPEVVFMKFLKRCGLEPSTEFPTTAFMSLLTDKAVQHINARGQCLWERFWQAAASKARPHAYWGETPGRLVLMGLRCLISVGALKNYEERTGRSGMFVMRISGDEYSNEEFEEWPLPWYESSFQEFPKHGSAKLLDEFYSSQSGRDLFVRALQQDMFCICHLFCESGMTAYYPDNAVQNGCRLNETIRVGLERSVGNHMIIEMFLYFMQPSRWDPRTYKLRFFESAWAEGSHSEQEELLAMCANAGLPVTSVAKAQETSNTQAEAQAEQ